MVAFKADGPWSRTSPKSPTNGGTKCVCVVTHKVWSIHLTGEGDPASGQTDTGPVGTLCWNLHKLSTKMSIACSTLTTGFPLWMCCSCQQWDISTWDHAKLPTWVQFQVKLANDEGWRSIWRAAGSRGHASRQMVDSRGAIVASTLARSQPLSIIQWWDGKLKRNMSGMPKHHQPEQGATCIRARVSWRDIHNSRSWGAGCFIVHCLCLMTLWLSFRNKRIFIPEMGTGVFYLYCLLLLICIIPTFISIWCAILK